MTKTFETETEAKNFARAKLDEGLIVFAGTTNPHTPRQLISSANIPFWIEGEQQQESAKPDGTQEDQK